ncbi:MAG: hypothetical protein JWN00_2002 [Actinomycetia bacterium]|nr:hypothetical protein [Actinomycetes bacterium]
MQRSRTVSPAGQLGDPNLFAHILRDQLQVTEEQSWAAVDRGERPRRPQPEGELADAPALDAKLARNLIVRVGMKPGDLVGISKEEAVEIWSAWLTTGRRPQRE